ncbi:MAG: LCP family protein [Synergistaceae bacterium]|nr:LCP family protein [Synergistaceae bacterium]
MRLIKIIGVIFMIIAALLGGATVKLMEVFNDPNPLPVPRTSRKVSKDKVTQTQTQGKSESVGDSELAISEKLTQEAARGSVNVLVVGLDNVDGASRTDAIALAIFDADNMGLRIASIPRDSRVYIPGRSWDKINHAYVYGGMNLLRETIVNLTGLPVDYFVKINYKSFPKLIDLIGGVDIYVDKKLVYNDYSGKLFINIPKGQQHMDGKTALGYVRFRHDPLGDIGRVQRQQKFINIVIDKLKSPAIIPKIPSLVNEVLNAVDTDLAPLEALKLLQFANSLSHDRIKMFMAPGKSGFSKNISYWILDNKAFSQQLSAEFSQADESLREANAGINLSEREGRDDEIPEGFDSEKIAALRDQILSIRILNGDGEKGIGKRAAAIFQRIGIEVPYTGNARHYDYRTSSIIYPPDSDDSVKQGAMALAELCGITNQKLIQPDRRATSLTLIIGHDKEELFRRLEPINS